MIESYYFNKFYHLPVIFDIIISAVNRCGVSEYSFQHSGWQNHPHTLSRLLNNDQSAVLIHFRTARKDKAVIEIIETHLAYSGVLNQDVFDCRRIESYILQFIHVNFMFTSFMASTCRYKNNREGWCNKVLFGCIVFWLWSKLICNHMYP